MGSLSGQVAVVTGGNSGIGRAVVLRFAAEGARVVVAARRQDASEAVAREVRERGGEALALPVDVRSEAAVQELFRAVLARWERVDVLVNNAGVGVWRPVREATVEEWDRVLDTNLKGPFLCAREAFPIMMRQGGGVILNVSSVAGKDAWEGTGVYSASKFGLLGLARALADEGRPHGIRVSSICPGMVDTPMIADEDVERRSDLIDPDEIARAALYLATLGRNVLVHEIVLDRKGAGES